MNATLEIPGKFKIVMDKWSPSFTEVFHYPKTPKEYEVLCDFAYQISDSLEKKKNKDQQAMLDIVTLLIDDYQRKNYNFEKQDPVSVLKFLIEDHGLVQKDLNKEIGSQGIVSEVLRGKRKLNMKMAKALATRFKTSVAVFI
jgi:HTH-type transcriptional regulator/antitoxin HigA